MMPSPATAIKDVKLHHRLVLRGDGCEGEKHVTNVIPTV